MALLAEWAALIGLCWVVLEEASSGGFSRSVVAFNRNQFHLDGGLARLLLVSESMVLPLAAGLALAFVVENRTPARDIATYYLAALLVAVGTIGKVGADTNYFLEAGLVMGLVLAVAWERCSRSVAAQGLAVAAAGMLALVAAQQVRVQVKARAQRASVESEVQLSLAGKNVITTEITSALRAGATPLLLDPYVFARAAEAGLVDQAPLLRGLRAQNAQAALVDADLSKPGASSRWTPQTSAVILDRYRLASAIGDHLYLYLPK
jgi:uncharacterized membrane protein (UPF0136 family)